MLSTVLDPSCSSSAPAILPLAPWPPTSPHPSAVKPQLPTWARLGAHPQEDHGHGGGENVRDSLVVKQQKCVCRAWWSCDKIAFWQGTQQDA